MRGTVEKRGKRYSIRLDLGKDPQTGKRHQKRISGFKTRREAEAELARIIAEYERGTLVLPSKMTVESFFRQWLDVHEEKLAFTTARQYRQIVEQHIIPAIGNLPLSSLTPMQIQKFLQQARNGRKDNKKSRGTELRPASVNYIYRVLRCALNTAVKWELIPQNPALKVEPPPSRGNDPVMLSPEEVESLLRGLEGSCLWLPAYLAVYTGMRLGEILALTWDDVDLERSLITVRRSLPMQPKPADGRYEFKEPKTKHSRRTIPLASSVVETLKKVREEQQRLKEEREEIWMDYNLVCCREDGTPLHPPTISSAFPKAARKLGYNISFHSLRDVHAGLLLQAGAPLKAISLTLGHGSGSVTMDKYIGLTPSVLRSVVEKVEELFDKNGKEVSGSVNKHEGS